MKQQVDIDIKAAMLSGDKMLTTTLRGLKSAILNVEIAENKRDQGLGDNEIITVFQKEAKKRQESADLYTQGGNAEKAQAELDEKLVIEKYLPAQMDEAQIRTIVDEVIGDIGADSMQQMGQIIGAVKQKTGAAADGAIIARLVKERLSQ